MPCARPVADQPLPGRVACQAMGPSVVPALGGRARRGDGGSRPRAVERAHACTDAAVTEACGCGLDAWGTAPLSVVMDRRSIGACPGVADAVYRSKTAVHGSIAAGSQMLLHFFLGTPAGRVKLVVCMRQRLSTLDVVHSVGYGRRSAPSSSWLLICHIFGTRAHVGILQVLI